MKVSSDVWSRGPIFPSFWLDTTPSCRHHAERAALFNRKLTLAGKLDVVLILHIGCQGGRWLYECDDYFFNSVYLMYLRNGQKRWKDHILYVKWCIRTRSYVPGTVAQQCRSFFSCFVDRVGCESKTEKKNYGRFLSVFPDRKPTIISQFLGCPKQRNRKMYSLFLPLLLCSPQQQKTDRNRSTFSVKNRKTDRAIFFPRYFRFTTCNPGRHMIPTHVHWILWNVVF